MNVNSFDAHCALVELADDQTFIIRFAEPVMQVCRLPDEDEFAEAEHERWTAHDRSVVCRTDAELARALERAKKASLKIRELLSQGKLACE